MNYERFFACFSGKPEEWRVEACRKLTAGFRSTEPLGLSKPTAPWAAAMLAHLNSDVQTLTARLREIGDDPERQMAAVVSSISTEEYNAAMSAAYGKE